MKVKIFEQDLTSGGKLAILIGGMDSVEPKNDMDKVVSKYVDGNTYNDFVDYHLDNPWVRVVIQGMNELNYEEKDL